MLTHTHIAVQLNEIIISKRSFHSINKTDLIVYLTN